MARRRMLDPEFFFDEELAHTTNSSYVRLFYQGLWCHCDDVNHTVPNRPEWLKAQIFPYEEIEVADLWKELVKTGKVVEFMSENGNSFGWLKNFGKHQRIEKPSKSKYPAFLDAPVVVGEDYGSTPAKEKRREVKLSKEKTASISYLSDIPQEKLKELTETYETSSAQVKKKALDLVNYCAAKGKTYKNYHAFLENALSKDFGRRVKLQPKVEEVEMPLDAEALARVEALKVEIGAVAKRMQV